MDLPSEPHLKPFYSVNIHERRAAAHVARALPLTVVLITLLAAALGVWRYPLMLLVICAVFNVSMWLFICSVALFGIWGSIGAEGAVAVADKQKDSECEALAKATGSPETRTYDNQQDTVRHAIVLPNYKEDEDMLEETLSSLTEAWGSADFLVVLAMEEREKEASGKAARLLEKFKGHFARITDCYHTSCLMENHMDGSWDYEVPGKASNLKYAVAKTFEFCKSNPDTFNPDNVILTVADADCLFHPAYFTTVAGDYYEKRAKGKQHRWTMWQAPQLPFRNYYLSPIPARVWGYISSVYEFGGVSSLACGGHHMVFSAYSLHLKLGVDGDLWDGDVIAEDHHAYIKAFLYAAWSSALEAKTNEGQGCRPSLQVCPVMLPVKSTSVVSAEGYWQSWVARWHQACRHTQGVAELSYACLAVWDLLCNLPLHMYTTELAYGLVRVVFRPFITHIVPICQASSLGILTLWWIFHHRTVPHCPDRIWLASSDGQVLLCGLAGAWALFWPVAIPMALMAVSNFLFIKVAFLQPAMPGPDPTSKKECWSRWHKEHGGIVEMFGSRSIAACCLIILDIVLFMGPVMVVYGLFAELLGCWNVMLRGNRYEYITAAKATKEAPDYGSIDSNEKPIDAAAAA